MMKKNTKKLFLYSLVLLICAFSVFPFLWMVSTSLKPPTEIYQYPPELVSSHLTTEGYRTILKSDSGSFNFMRWIANSLIVSVASTVFSIVVAAMGAYSLSRYRFAGRGGLMYTIMITQMMPASLLVIPLYIIMMQMKLLDSMFGLTLAYIAFTVPYCTWSLKGYFDTIPTALDEAARIDGCSPWKAFSRVVLPLATPGLVSTSIFAFVTCWNEFMFASVFMKNYDNWTIPVGLTTFKGQYATNWNGIMAGGVIITVPVVIIFLLMQKYLIAGMTAGAVKQ